MANSTSGDRYSAASLVRFGSEALRHVGASAEAANVVAEALVEADAKSVHSHGLRRLPVYVAGVESGGIDAEAAPTWTQTGPATGTVDGHFAFGQLVMHVSVQRAMELAADAGAAVVGARQSTHFGIGSRWTETAARHGFASLLMSTTGAVVAPHGSRERLLGTNPLTMSVPSAGGDPVTLDMATSAGAYGKVVQASAEGNELPPGWAVDEHGQATTDPDAALQGSLVPFGGHKGSAISVMIELLAAACTGGRFSNEIVDVWADSASRMGTGHLLLLFDASATSPGDAAERISGWLGTLRSSSPAVGHDAVMAPGDPERAAATRAHEDGVSLPSSVVHYLHDLARHLDITMPEPNGGPA